MSIRQILEQEEHVRFSEHAQFSDASRGRLYPEEPAENDVRSCYQRDCDRILHSKSFRRLMHKTQVFLQPEGDHYRTRMTHTLEVARVARTIARALRLNEDLTEAIAFGHDLGHTPFGHAGEVALSEVMGREFHHNEQSLRVVDELEKGGQGLNLTYEVRMGILGHTSGSRMPETLEGQIVRKADQIAYINHDIDDAIRGGVLTENDIPQEISDVLGHTHRDRINTLVTNMIFHTRKTGVLGMEDMVDKTMQDLRNVMFERVYKNPVAKGEESKARRILQELYEYYIRHPEALPADFQPQISFDGMPRVVCDYIAGMTDKYAMYKYSELFIPTAWQMRD
ncbi:MAG: deoxyguanosinetriphosphate triphosphohydrolase [Oscillospiraceae bacterium]|jgi:dGTPase|nr:deoxyguanosinetriphosphate triphosphohydrolase [Oscillospiraceae bacterium]